MDIQGIYNLLAQPDPWAFAGGYYWQCLIMRKLEHFNYAIEKGEMTSSKPRPFW